jgi:hypothetical protein
MNKPEPIPSDDLLIDMALEASGMTTVEFSKRFRISLGYWRGRKLSEKRRKQLLHIARWMPVLRRQRPNPDWSL